MNAFRDSIGSERLYSLRGGLLLASVVGLSFMAVTMLGFTGALLLVAIPLVGASFLGI